VTSPAGGSESTEAAPGDEISEINPSDLEEKEENKIEHDDDQVPSKKKLPATMMENENYHLQKK